jgi:hypothetical protein
VQLSGIVAVFPMACQAWQGSGTIK